MDSTNKDLSHSLFHCSFSPICQERICTECGNGHSFRNNEGVKTSINLISELLPELFRIGASTQSGVNS